MSIKVQSLGSAGSAVGTLLISGATNATPIVITLAAGHGLKAGDRLAISGITGNTGANGEWTLGSVGATTATLLGSVGNGAYGGTPRSAVVMNNTPFMKNHSASLEVFGNLIGTVDFEAYESYADFAAGANTAGASAPVQSASFGTNTNGSAVLPAKTTYIGALTNAAAVVEVQMPRYMRTVVTAYTSGTFAAALKA